MSGGKRVPDRRVSYERKTDKADRQTSNAGDAVSVAGVSW